jgi:hypothetical protein
VYKYFVKGFSSGYGYDALAIAVLGKMIADVRASGRRLWASPGEAGAG